MPWPKEHKALTRDRIVGAAASAFRRRGVSGVRVDEVMGEAGLTHGGFYAHFSSKDDLVSAALAHASCQTLETLSQALESVPAEQRLRAVIDAYLSPQHAAHPERGCPLAALGPEVARARGRPQRDLAQAVRRRLDWLRDLNARKRRDSVRDAQAVGALAGMVGGLILARVVGGAEAESILEACREFLHRAAGESSPVSGRSTSRGQRRKRGAARRRQSASR